MRFILRDLTDQYISASYQDVLQQYIASPTSYVLDGYGNVFFSIPSSSIGGTLVVTNNTGSTYVSSSILFNTTPFVPAWEEGRVFWDETNHTIALYNDQPEITHQLGQETLVRVVAGEYIPNGTPVYISSSLLTYPLVKLALAQGTRASTYQVMGIATQNIQSGSQ